MGCNLHDSCGFFDSGSIQELSGLASLLKSRYCNGDPERCARFRVYATYGMGAVPADMRPNDHSAAEEILAGFGARPAR